MEIPSEAAEGRFLDVVDCKDIGCNFLRAQFQAELLLDGGYLRDAEQLLTTAATHVRSDPAFNLAMIRLHLLQQNFEAADQWIETLRQHGISGQVNVLLGNACQTARRDALAGDFYDAAVKVGHYPEANLGLAALATHRRDVVRARQHILTSLNTCPPLGESAASPLDLFTHSLGLLLQLENPVPNARAWVATLHGGVADSPLAGLSFQIYATDQQQAADFLRTIAAAMQPDRPPNLPAALAWKPAPRDQQPVGAVRPGIQYFWR